MSESDLQSQINLARFEQKQLFEQRDALNDQIVALNDKIEELMALQLQGYQPTLPDILDVGYQGRECDAWFNIQQEWFKNLGLTMDGFIPQTRQRVIRLKISKQTSDSDLEKLHTTLQYVGPHIKPSSFDHLNDYFDQARLFTLLTNDCGYSGIPKLWWLMDGSCVLTFTCYGRTELVDQTPDLMSGLKYVREHYSYH